MRITFADDKATWHFNMGGNKWQSFDGVCRIDPMGNAGWIDLGQPQSEDPTRIALGIYQIDGDTLTISMDAQRPASFEQPALTKLRFKRDRRSN